MVGTLSASTQRVCQGPFRSIATALPGPLAAEAEMALKQHGVEPLPMLVANSLQHPHDAKSALFMQANRSLGDAQRLSNRVR